MTRALEIAKISGLAFIQDGGRPGRMHEGVPPGGPLVPDRLRIANIGVKNEPLSAAIEVLGEMAVISHGEVTVADDDGNVAELQPGQKFFLRSSRSSRVGYLAARGGIDVPTVLGGRGTLLVASLGGFEGRMLKVGDVLPIGDAPVANSEALERPARDIRVLRGPDLGDEAWHALLSSRWTISPSSDRIGTRLVGPPIPRGHVSGSAPSMPMVTGAMEVPPSGQPIVLGPDHMTVGGHPVLAVVLRADLGAFHSVPLGRAVTFSSITVEQARRSLRHVVRQR